jgi:hypothetical protein
VLRLVAAFLFFAALQKEKTKILVAAASRRSLEATLGRHFRGGTPQLRRQAALEIYF